MLILYRLTYALNKEEIYSLVIEADSLFEGIQTARTHIDGEYGLGSFDKLEGIGLLKLEPAAFSTSNNVYNRELS